MGQTPTFDGTKIKNIIHIAAIFLIIFFTKLKFGRVEQVFSSHSTKGLESLLPALSDLIFFFVLLELLLEGFVTC